MAIIDGGNRAGAVVSVLWDFVSDCGGPEELAVFDGKGADALAFFITVEISSGVEDAIGDGDGGESFTGAFRIPKELGWGFFPVLDDAGFRGESGAIGTTPLGPVFRLEQGAAAEYEKGENREAGRFHLSNYARKFYFYDEKSRWRKISSGS